MAVKAYYDSSGKSDDPHISFLTLSGYAGDPTAWSKFDELWLETLRDRDPAAPYLHMKEAMHLRKAFSKSLGWNTSKVKRLLVDLGNNCLGEISTGSMKGQIAEFSCTVDMTAYREIKTQYPLLQRAELICIDIALGQMLRSEGAQERPDGSIEIYFDRDEPFMGLVQKAWRRRSSKPWWSEIVKIVEPVDMRHVPGIQAADLVAWTMNRERTTGEDLLSSMVIGLTRRCRIDASRDLILKYAEDRSGA